MGPERLEETAMGPARTESVKASSPTGVSVPEAQTTVNDTGTEKSANGQDAVSPSDSDVRRISGEHDKSGENDEQAAKPRPMLPHLEDAYERREDLLFEIRRRTGIDFSSPAIEGFLDNVQAIDLLIKAATYREPTLFDDETKSKVGKRQIAKPEIQRMNWREWSETTLSRSQGTRKNHTAIDALFDEVQPWTITRQRPLVSVSSARASTTTECAPDADTKKEGAAPAPKPLPSRIRINSVPAKRILDAICDDILAFISETDPLVIVRPFKVLSLMEQDIRARMAEIETLLTERLSKRADPRESSKPQTEEVNGSIGRPVSNGQAADEDAQAVKSGKTAEVLAKRVFPRDMIFFGGTDWSTLTDSEVEEARNDFRCLLRFMDDTLMPARNYLQDKPSVINFHNMWHLFKCGGLIYVRDRTVPQKVMRVIQATGGRKYLSPPTEEMTGWDAKYSPFVLDCYYLDFDGTKYVRVYHRFKIEMFEDSIPVTSLQVMPLHVAQNASLTKTERLRQRGEQFLTYTRRSSPQHRYYQGTTVTQTPCGKPLFRRNPDDINSQRLFTERIESQVVVDFERGIQANPDWGPVINEIDLWKIDNAELEEGVEYVEKDNVWDTRTSEDFLDLEQDKWQRWDKGEAMPEGDDVLLFPNRVFGYVLRTRSWACLRLSADDSEQEYLSRVDQRPDAWQDLEIPQGHKSIVQALINTHFSKDKTKDAHFDLVREKGKGVIILLHGVPGVGKTATAECVAASHGKPLLPITCGDLGLKPKEVESTLQTAFQLAQAWDCVMLLDEADIFLAQRTNQDVERNALVSVFLRILEYYEGILFLTTNRVGSFDEAFKSRIHMALYYPPLNWLTTEKIWRNLIRRAQESPMKVEFNIDALVEFAWHLHDDQHKNNNSIGPVWNGRQIRNAFQSAIALARNESDAARASSVVVEKRHFNTVAEVSNEFNHYIWKVKSGRTDADIAQEVGARADDFTHARYAQGPSIQSQASHFSPPAQTQMPMRQATPGMNPLGLAPSNTPFQQPAYPAATGSPYNPTQQAFYGSAQQPPPQFNAAQGYGQQQSRSPFGQHLQATPAQQYAMPADSQYQTPSQQPTMGYGAPPAPPVAQSGYTAAAGGAEPGIPSQAPRTVDQRA